MCKELRWKEYDGKNRHGLCNHSATYAKEYDKRRALSAVPTLEILESTFRRVYYSHLNDGWAIFHSTLIFTAYCEVITGIEKV